MQGNRIYWLTIQSNKTFRNLGSTRPLQKIDNELTFASFSCTCPVRRILTFCTAWVDDPLSYSVKTKCHHKHFSRAFQKKSKGNLIKIETIQHKRISIKLNIHLRLIEYPRLSQVKLNQQPTSCRYWSLIWRSIQVVLLSKQWAEQFDKEPRQSSRTVPGAEAHWSMSNLNWQMRMNRITSANYGQQPNEPLHRLGSPSRPSGENYGGILEVQYRALGQVVDFKSMFH